jgi:hypothetical protein
MTTIVRAACPEDAVFIARKGADFHTWRPCPASACGGRITLSGVKSDIRRAAHQDMGL